jgi:hypothetical protein
VPLRFGVDNRRTTGAGFGTGTAAADTLPGSGATWRVCQAHLSEGEIVPMRGTR